MSVNQRNPVAYGLSQATIDVPSKPIVAQRSPTDRDKAQIGTLWINATDQSVYIITSIEDNVANWELLTNAGGTVTDLEDDSGNLAVPINGIIAVLGGDNINTVAMGSTLTVSLNPFIILPNTNFGATQGYIQFGTDRFISNYGTNNVFVGQESGTALLSAADANDNSGFGAQTLQTLTTGSNNCAYGSQTLKSITDGSFNTGIGFSSLNQLPSGDNNICIGDLSGSAYTTTESDNIIIGNSLGTIGDNNVLRIGNQGSGDDEQDTAYIAGITGSALTANSQLVLCGPDAKLGTLAGADGQILIGQTGATPQWGTLVSGGGSVTITYPTANTINLEAAGVAALTGLDGDAGSAAPMGGIIVIAGDGVTTSTSAAADTVTVALTNGTNGQLLIGGGANPIWANLTSTGGSVTITNGANSINLEAAGVAALTQLSGDTGTATPIAGNIDIVGSSIITTIALGDTLAIRSTTANNGQIPIGRTDTGIPVWSTITAGSGIAITNGANSITIAATGAEPTRPAFYYKQTSDLTISRNNTMYDPYFLGTNAALTSVFDQGSNVFPGDGIGTAASFTAPVDGIYWFRVAVDFETAGTGATPLNRTFYATINSPSEVLVEPSRADLVAGSGPVATPLNYAGVLNCQGILRLTMGQQVFFSIGQAGYNVLTPATYQLSVYGDTGYTSIQGYLVSPL